MIPENTLQSKVFAFLGIGVIVFAVFFPSLFCDFTNFDDNWMVTSNHLIRSLSWKNISGNIFGSVYKGVYQPLVFLSFSIEYYFFKLNPFVYHLDNIVLHVLNAFLVFIFINQLTESKQASLLGSLFWAISPLRVESATWITERKDLLYGFFYLLALIKYVQYIKSGGRKMHFYLSLVFFVLSCISKLTAVSLSFIIVLLDYYFERKPYLKSIIEKIVFFSISLGVGLFSLWALHKDDEVTASYQYSFTERAELVSHSLVNYFIKSVIPYNLSVFHPYQYPPGFLPKIYIVFLIITIIGAAGFLWYFLRGGNRKIIFGLLFFISAVIFALQIIPVGDASFADRNIYISCIGTAFLFAEGFKYLIKKIPPLIITSAFIGIVSLYGILTYGQTKIWKNSITLFSDVIEKYPDSYLGYLNRGIARNHILDYKGAMEDFNLSLEKNKKYFKTLLNRALLREKMNDPQGALNDYNEILAFSPDYRNALIARGALLHKKNKLSEAIVDFSRAIKIFPPNQFLNSVALVNRAQSFFSLNKIDSAITDLYAALNIVPDNSEAWYLRGLCYFTMKDFLRAEQEFLHAISLDPKNGNAFYSLGMCEVSLNKPKEACEYLHKSALLSSMDGNKMYLFHCSDPVSRKKMFYPNGNFKFTFSRKINSNNDTLFYLSNLDSMGTTVRRGLVDINTNKLNGDVAWFFPDSSLQKTGFLRDTIPFGSWKEFYPSGNVRLEYSFENGLKTGMEREFFENGKIHFERWYNNGKIIKENIF